jgi:hypothetical protein
VKVYIEKEVSSSDMVRIDIDEINRMLDAGNQLASDNEELQRELSYLRSFSEESQLTGQAWGAAKSVSTDAYIPLVQGKIAYNEAVISGNKKVRRAVEAFRYRTPLDEKDLVNALNGYKQSRNDYQEMIREINYNETVDPLMSPYYENLRQECQWQVDNLSAAIDELNRQIQAMHDFTDSIRGAYDEANSIKAQLDRAVSALGHGGSTTYQNGHFTVMTMTDWAFSLSEDYELKVNTKKYNQIIATLDTEKMSETDAKAYKDKIRQELAYLDSKGWNEKGEKDYVKYLNAEYKNFIKDDILHLTSDSQWIAPNGAGSLLIKGLHNFIENSGNDLFIKTSFASPEGMPKTDLSGKSQWSVILPDGERFDPAFLSYFGDDIPNINIKKTTFEVRPLATSGQQYDPDHPYIYYLFSDGKFNKDATQQFFYSGSSIQSDYFVNSAVERTVNKVVVELATNALFLAATPLDPEGLPIEAAQEFAAEDIAYFGTESLGITSAESFAKAVVIENGHLTESSIAELAKLAETGPTDSGVVTLGRFKNGSPFSYEQAGYRDANLGYNLGKDGWNAVTQQLKDVGMTDTDQLNDEMWKVNEKFLDNQISDSKEFNFTQNPDTFEDGTFGSRERLS